MPGGRVLLGRQADGRRACTGKDFCDFDLIDGRWECKAPNISCAIG